MAPCPAINGRTQTSLFLGHFLPAMALPCVHRSTPDCNQVKIRSKCVKVGQNGPKMGQNRGNAGQIGQNGGQKKVKISPSILVKLGGLNGSQFGPIRFWRCFSRPSWPHFGIFWPIFTHFDPVGPILHHFCPVLTLCWPFGPSRSIPKVTPSTETAQRRPLNWTQHQWWPLLMNYISMLPRCPFPSHI